MCIRDRRPRNHGPRRGAGGHGRVGHRREPEHDRRARDELPLTITDLQESAPAILWTTHAGQETGNAVADVLFGDVNPAGRLTQTWYNSLDDLPADLLNYDIINTQQTYLYDDTTPLYPFGYGLSYTSFDYSH